MSKYPNALSKHNSATNLHHLLKPAHTFSKRHIIIPIAPKIVRIPRQTCAQSGLTNGLP